MDNRIKHIYSSSKTVFTLRDLAILWRETDANNLKSAAAYYVRRGALVRLARGVFAKSREYEPKELATSIYAPSYISFETALREAGMIFQHYDTIFVASQLSRHMVVDGHSLAFRKMKDSVLFHPAGILIKEGYSIASPERAFLDMLYSVPQASFDNLRQLDWGKCFDLIEIYDNQQLAKRLNRYYKQYAQ